jgi:hypothetical protein
MLSHSDINVLVHMVNVEFRKIVTFFRTNKLALHPAKTKFMLFTNSNVARSMNLEIVMNFNNVNENRADLIFPIERVTNNSSVPAIRFLGVYFDENLNFKYHISLLTSKLSKTLFIMRSVKNLLSERALKSVYYALFHSNLIYCIQVWSSTANSNISHITTMQKKAIRLILNQKYNAHSEPLFKKLEILPLPQLISFFNLQFMQQYTQGFLPISFNNVWLLNAERHREDFVLALRNRENLNVPFARLQSSTNQPLIKFPRMWAQFDNEDVKILRNKLEFNKELKKHFLKKLSANITCHRLLCPSCHL